MHLESGGRDGSNQVVPSSYRFSGPFVARLAGSVLVALGLAVVLLLGVTLLLPLPSYAVVVVVALAAVATLVVAVGLVVLRRSEVIRFDDVGFRVRLVRGAGCRLGEWRQVEDVTAAVVAGEKCVVMRMRDGRTSTVPVGVLAVSPDDFVADLQAHLDHGHGYQRRPPRRS